MRSRVLVDGTPADGVPADDRGLHYGDGLFETLAAPDGKPELLQLHLDRLERGAAALGFGKLARDAITEDVSSLSNAHGDCVVKIILTRGSGGRGYRPPVDVTPRRIVSVHDWPRHDPAIASKGARVVTCKTRIPDDPAFAGIKTLNRLHQVIAAREVRDAGADEGMMLDRTGHAVCGTMCNVFVVRNGELLTPDVSRCGVAGVIRDRLLEGAGLLGIDTQIVMLDAAGLASADEIFVTNSVVGLWPVGSLDGHPFEVGPVTTACREWLMKQVLERTGWI